jgi:retron-type reverse transcriptase
VNLQAHIDALGQRLQAQRSRANLVRRWYIPKENGTERPRGIPTRADQLVPLAGAKLLTAISAQDVRECRDGYRPGRGALEAVRDLTVDLPYGRYGDVVEAEVQGSFDHVDHPGPGDMRRVRSDARAFLHLIRTWFTAGILDRDGQVIHPETGTPQGGTGSPVLAKVYWHEALDLWCAQIVPPSCRGEALRWRSADDWGCAFRYQEEAERLDRVLPKR